MAFWGVEVKPGNPYKHRYNNAQGRLHISQATLGSGQSTEKSITIQCNAGDKSPVLLCSLLPERIESCHLNLEFEEDYEVIFSVIGPRSVHLTGFYLAPSRGFDRHDDDSDSYGEDIAQTDTDRSSDYNTEDDKYESDFIDDGDPETSSPSPKRKCRVTIKEIVDDGKPARGTRTTRRLRKKYHPSDSDSGDKYLPSDSDSGDSFQPQNVGKNSRNLLLDDEDDDAFPVSTTFRSKHIVDDAVLEDKSDNMATEDGMKEELKDDGSQCARLKRKIHVINQNGECDRGADRLSNSLAVSHEDASENGGKSKKEKKEKSKKSKISHTDERAGEGEATTGCKTIVLTNFKAEIWEEKIVNRDQDMIPWDELKEKLTIDNCAFYERLDREMNGSTVLLDAIAPESNGKLKKKKGKAKEKTVQPNPSAEMEVKAPGDDHDEHPKNAVTDEEIGQDPSVKAQEANAKLLDYESLDRIVDLAGADCQNECKKKKKKTNKTKQGDASVIVDESGIAIEEAKTNLTKKICEQKDQACPSKAKSFSNGLVIEELSIGKPDDKKADPGNKVSIHYVGKFKKNGEIFDSNIGRKPLKFRLGAGKVIKGLDIGVAGMYIGEKRRLTIPPSMGYGAQDEGELPANAWLVYDVELVDVH